MGVAGGAWCETLYPPRVTHHAIYQMHRAGMSLSEQASPREYPRPTEATKDTSCRCYLRGPDGVRRLSPSGTWDTVKYIPDPGSGKSRSRLHDWLRDLAPLTADDGLLHDQRFFLHADRRSCHRVLFGADLRHP